MPYSDNKNTISACSQILKMNDHKEMIKKSLKLSEDCSSRSISSNDDVYYSCKAKYNNKNNTLMICKKASSTHMNNNYLKRY